MAPPPPPKAMILYHTSHAPLFFVTYLPLLPPLGVSLGHCRRFRFIVSPSFGKLEHSLTSRESIPLFSTKSWAAKHPLCSQVPHYFFSDFSPPSIIGVTLRPPASLRLSLLWVQGSIKDFPLFFSGFFSNLPSPNNPRTPSSLLPQTSPPICL